MNFEDNTFPTARDYVKLHTDFLLEANIEFYIFWSRALQYRNMTYFRLGVTLHAGQDPKTRNNSTANATTIKLNWLYDRENKTIVFHKGQGET